MLNLQTRNQTKITRMKVAVMKTKIKATSKTPKPEAAKITKRAKN
jgi:hypothetical protein